MSDEADISNEAMEIMHAVAYDHRRLPLNIGPRQLSRLSEYECLAIDRAIRKQGLVLEYGYDHDEFTVRESGL